MTDSWIAVLAVGAVAAALLAVGSPRIRGISGTVVLLVSALTAWILSLGE